MKSKSLKITALAGIAGLLGLSIVSDAAALPDHAFQNYYYSDAAHTNLIGTWHYDCFHFTKTGVQTGYQVHIDGDECP